MGGLANSRPLPKMKNIHLDGKELIIQDNKLLVERKRLVQIEEDWKIDIY
jgi:hypothetical protein